MSLINSIIKRYRGGPNFNKSQRISYMLENYKVSLLLPICNPPKAPRAKIVNYPMSEPGWFEQHYSFIAHSKYIAVHESYWFYWPLVPIPLQGELGGVRFNLSIEKLPESSKFSMSMDEFGRLLLKTYNDYYNCETVGDYLLGGNTEIINGVEEQSAKRGEPWSEAEKEELVALRIKSRGHPLITEYEILENGDNTWVLYKEKKGSTGDVRYIFSFLLNNGYYLTAEFSLDVNMSTSDKPWYQEAIKALSLMMSVITVEYIPDESHSEEALLNNTSGQNLLAAK